MSWYDLLFRRQKAAPPASVAPAASARKKPAFDIADFLPGMARIHPREKAIDPFKAAEHPPGAIPPGAKGIAMDNAIAGANAWALSGIDPYALSIEGFIGYPALAILAQKPEYRRISETLATEMTREFVEITATGDHDKTAEIQRINEELKRLDVAQVFKVAAEQDSFYGRAHIFMDFDDLSDEELKTPLVADAAKIVKGGIKELRTIEALWVYPLNYNSTKPLRNDWYRPEHWSVMGDEIHHTRMLTFIGRPVPDILKPAYSFGGLSMSQMAKSYIDNFLRVRDGTTDLVESFSQFVLSTNLAEKLQGDGSGLIERASWFNKMRSNRGLMIIDKALEDFKNVSASLTGLNEILSKSQEFMAAVSAIPIVKLLGIQPAGLNASSAGELESFYTWINSYQKVFFTPNFKRLLDIIQISLFGKIDPAITFKYKSLWSLSEVDSAALRKTEAETDEIYIRTRVITRGEVRQRVAADEDTPYASLDAKKMPPLEAVDVATISAQRVAMVSQAFEAGIPDRPTALRVLATIPGIGEQIGQDQIDDADQDAPQPSGLSPKELAAQARLEQATGNPEAQAPTRGAQDEFIESEHPRGSPKNKGEFTANAAAVGRSASSSSPTASGMVERGAGAAPPHIAALKIPPAWKDVRYNPDPKGKLLVTGKDAKGRRTAIYSAEYVDKQAAQKFARINELAQKFDAICKQNDAAGKNPKLAGESDCLQLIMTTGVRPGSETDTGAEKKAYGATTLTGSHVVVDNGKVSLRFVGKKGVSLNLPVTDEKTARMLVARKQAAGDSGKLFGISDADLLAHVHALDGGKFKTKDFRTLLGTKTAMAEVAAAKARPADLKDYKKAVHDVAKKVAAKLGNTPTVALQSYISPTVFADWRLGIP